MPEDAYCFYSHMKERGSFDRMKQRGSKNQRNWANHGSAIGITQLHYNISQNDLKELFSLFPDLGTVEIDYDNSDRSLGTAKVYFVNPDTAVAALEMFNGQALDGQSIQIEILQKPSIEDRLGGRKSIDDRLGKRIDDRLGKRIDDRLGKRIQDRLGDKQKQRRTRKPKPDAMQLDVEMDNVLLFYIVYGSN
jgi:RNA recognition motif-containing protein